MDGLSSTSTSAPETKDGTIIASTEKSPLPMLAIPEHGEQETRKRRTTVTFGEKTGLGVVPEDEGRKRGNTVGEPEMIGRLADHEEKDE
jgi:hypothetical protein